MINNHEGEDGRRYTYIGLTSLDGIIGKYYWIDGSPLNYTNWKKGRGLG